MTGTPATMPCPSFCDLINDGEKLLTGTGTTTARLDAQILLCHAIKKDRAFILARLKDETTDEIGNLFNTLIHRRATGEPLAHITGEKEFYSLNFKVTKDTLVPRPETELLVETVLDFYGADTKIDVIDIGTGSGAIAVTLAVHRPSWNITACDISEKALAIAKDNASVNGVAENIDFLVSNLFESLPAKKFDIIVSNPPYIALDDDSVSCEVKEHEPHCALFAGEKGLDVIERLINESKNRLCKNGYLVMEIGFAQADNVRKIVEQSGLFKVEKIAKDLQGIDRIFVARKL